MRAEGGDDYVGKIISGKYRIEQMIGEGGMGRVYKALQVALDKPVVLKVLRKSLLSDERTVQRFQREAKAASRLNHANSISVLDFGRTDDGALFIAMEFVSGKDLHQILSKEWPLPEARIIRIISQVLSALADAHSAGVIHRDLKPENIMVEQRRGEPDFVKVLDFGIAKITDSTGDDGPALTRAGFVCGTPEYMSPEQARGGALDARSDLYSVGVILYQLTTGLLPFESDSAVGFATKHLSEEPPPPSKRRPDARISPAMERLIMRVLSKDPNQRPATAEAFRSELAAVGREGKNGPRRTPQVLGPIPRKVSAEESATTRITSGPQWGEREDTVRADPGALSSSTRPGKPVATDEVIAASAGGGGVMLLKLLTVAMFLIAVGIGGWFLYQRHQAAPEDYQPPPNAPLQLADKPGAGNDKPLYEHEVPKERRDPERALRAAREADDAHQRGLVDVAAQKYQEAFAADPSPELALKLGELYFQKNDSQKARGWWSRHLRDASSSRARTYIQQVFPEVGRSAK